MWIRGWIAGQWKTPGRTSRTKPTLPHRRQAADGDVRPRCEAVARTVAILNSSRSRAAATALAGVVGYDLLQRRRAILRNFPILGHLRYALEAFGPELRQYIVTSNNEERPFSRDQRRWIYASSEGKPNVFGFGTDDEMEAVESLLIIKHSPFPAPAPAAGESGGPPVYGVPAAKVLGAGHGRRHAFRPLRS